MFKQEKVEVEAKNKESMPGTVCNQMYVSPRFVDELKCVKKVKYFN